MAVTLTVAPDFKALCPALTDEERRLLEELIVEEGCREPITVWKCGKQTIIVDGHNRHEICVKRRIPHKLRYLKIDSRQGAIGWAARNQLGRRNATEEQKSYLRGKLYRETKTDQGGDHKSKGQNVTLIDAATTIGEETGVDGRTVKRDEKYMVAVDALAEKSPALKDAALRGDVPKSAVPALAAAPKSELRKMEKLEGKELRKAATGKKPDASKARPPKQFPRSHWFKQWEQQIGPLVRLVDKIADGLKEKRCRHHEAVQELLNSATEEMTKWLKAK